MIIFLGILVYAVIGTIIGRILFVKTLGNSKRFTLDTQYSSYTNKRETEVISTSDLHAASLYGLWSILVWPMTLSFFLIQAPTPDERRELKQTQLDEIRKQLEAVAKDFDLKLIDK
jgi:hypothetical protein